MFVLHVGPHKTATTWMQANFHANRKRLLELGWLYPVTGERVRIAHHDLSDFPESILKPGSPVTRQFKAIAADATARGLNVLMSAEGFRHWESRHMEALRQAIAPHRLHIVYTVRDPLDVIPSFWAQQVKTSHPRTLPDYADKHMVAGLRSPVLNPLKELAVFAAIPDSALTILSYEEIRRQTLDIVDVFTRSVLSVPDLPKIGKPSSNTRDPLELTSFMLMVLQKVGNWREANSVQIGRAFRYLLTPWAHRRIMSTVAAVPDARREVEIDRDTPVLRKIEAEILARFSDRIVPAPMTGGLFGTGMGRLAYHDTDRLMADPAVGKLVADVSRALRPGGLRMRAANLGNAALVAWRRLAKRLG